LAGLATVGAPNDSERAAQQLGAAHALLDDIGAIAEIPWERPLLAATGNSLRGRLGDDAFTEAFERGRSAPQDVAHEAWRGTTRRKRPAAIDGEPADHHGTVEPA
jgi:hypothetical protein